MKKLILFGWAFAAVATAQPALVTVNGPINNTDGTGFTGRMTISNPRLLCLGVAIPALFGYNWLSSRSDAIVADMAVFVDEFATRLAEEQGDGRQMRPVLQQA